ncbi:MAG TPA: peptidoglycan DD-metalloendopeptidase family protein [Alphaproteobacteria bacterium]|nr:peptidoglycan DD-metalloendopeptidase family protein [Alphaproteobacteria bacterium]
MGAAFLAMIAAGPAAAETARGPTPSPSGIAIGKMPAQTFRDRSLELERKVAELRSRLVRIARTIQDAEAALTGIERDLMALGARETTLKAGLKRDGQAHAATLAALQRLARHPPETLAAHHGDAVRSARAAMMLEHHQRAVAARAASLRRRLVDLSALRIRIAGRRDTIARTTARLAVDRIRLAVMLAKGASLQHRSARDQRLTAARLKVLASAARNLRELLDSVEQTVRLGVAKPPVVPRGPLLSKPKSVRVFAAAHGKVIVPVRGIIISKYGRHEDSAAIGRFNKGVVFETRAEAQVVAPFDGRVVFAGSFRSYGLILIIDHGGGYHTLLAGLARVDIVVNQWLLGGEPVGAMSSTQSRSTRLYLEIRRRGQPINPLPWLAAQPSKANG